METSQNVIIMCLCKPCITLESNRQAWWETGNTLECEENSSSRKGHYRRFWVMFLYWNVWSDGRDKATKEALLTNAENVITGPSIRSSWREVILCGEMCLDLAPKPRKKTFLNWVINGYNGCNSIEPYRLGHIILWSSPGYRSQTDCYCRTRSTCFATVNGS